MIGIGIRITQTTHAPSSVAPATAGPNYPSVAAAGGFDAAWSNTANAFADDGAFATCTGSGESSNLLRLTGFGFAIPVGATITGVLVEIKKKASVDAGFNYVNDNTVSLIKGGAATGDNKAIFPAHWATASGYVSYGGEGDLWGLSLTAADINAANFGVALSIDFPGSATASVDAIRVTVFYTA